MPSEPATCRATSEVLLGNNSVADSAENVGNVVRPPRNPVNTARRTAGGQGLEVLEQTDDAAHQQAAGQVCRECEHRHGAKYSIEQGASPPRNQQRIAPPAPMTMNPLIPTLSASCPCP